MKRTAQWFLTILIVLSSGYGRAVADECPAGVSDLVTLVNVGGDAGSKGLSACQESAGIIETDFTFTLPATDPKHPIKIPETGDPTKTSELILLNAVTVSGTLTSDNGDELDTSERATLLTISLLSAAGVGIDSDALRIDKLGKAPTFEQIATEESEKDTPNPGFQIGVAGETFNLDEVPNKGVSDTITFNDFLFAGILMDVSPEDTGTDLGEGPIPLLTMQVTSCSPCPEPGTLLVLATGLLSFFGLRYGKVEFFGSRSRMKT